MAEMPVDTPEEPWVVEPEQLAARRDLRESHLIFSIDPLGCEDVDDALGARLLPNGNTELSVHIADVSYFVKQGLFAAHHSDALPFAVDWGLFFGFNCCQDH